MENKDTKLKIISFLEALDNLCAEYDFRLDEGIILNNHIDFIGEVEMTNGSIDIVSNEIPIISLERKTLSK